MLSSETRDSVRMLLKHFLDQLRAARQVFSNCRIVVRVESLGLHGDQSRQFLQFRIEFAILCAMSDDDLGNRLRNVVRHLSRRTGIQISLTARSKIAGG